MFLFEYLKIGVHYVIDNITCDITVTIIYVVNWLTVKKISKLKLQIHFPHTFYKTNSMSIKSGVIGNS